MLRIEVVTVGFRCWQILLQKSAAADGWFFPQRRLQVRRDSPGSTFPICRRTRRRMWCIALPTRPRSADRTRSPAPVSRKREYFKYPPETIGDFAPGDPNSGARRPIGNSQKPAIGGPLWHCRGQSLRAPDWLAGAGGFEPPYGGIKIHCLTTWRRPNRWSGKRDWLRARPADFLRPRRSIEGVEPFQQARPANSP